MTLNYVKTALIALSTLSLMACGKGFQATSDGLSSGSNGSLGSGDSTGTGGGGTTGPTVDQQWQSVKTQQDGTVDGATPYKGSLLIQIDKARQAVVLIMPLPSVFLLPMISSMPIPEMPGASVEMVTRSDGSMAMGVVVPLHYLVKGSSFSNYATLPNGEPLPGMPVGEARGFAISFPQKPSYRLHVYMAVNAAAVFVETPDFKLPAEVSLIPTIAFPIKNAAKTQVVGYFAVVPNRGSFNSGVFVSSRLPASVAIMIDELLQY
ncbi:MAG: hypothetical protein KF681_04270 [Bdellovibrionaceae bacterium]|nr:hypothetical protein [Pseudobdellovibrionaceae bacterium]